MRDGIGHRWVILTLTISTASIAGHLAVCGISPLAFIVTVQLAALLALPMARFSMGFASIAFAALGSQVLLHMVMASLSHGHGALLPSINMIAGHAVAAMLIAAVTWQADAIVEALQRIFTAHLLAPGALPLLAFPLTGSRQRGFASVSFGRSWIRGPPLFAASAFIVTAS